VVAWTARLGAGNQIVRVLAAADHVDVELGDDVLNVDGRELIKILRSPKALFLARVPYEQHRALRPYLRLCEGFGASEHSSGPGTVIVRAVPYLVIAGCIFIYADVVIVCADGDHFVFEHGVAALPNGCDLLSGFDGLTAADLDRRGLSQREPGLGIHPRAFASKAVLTSLARDKNDRHRGRISVAAAEALNRHSAS